MIDFIGNILNKLNFFTDKFIKSNKEELINCRVCGKKCPVSKGSVCSIECEEKYKRDLQGKLDINESLQ